MPIRRPAVAGRFYPGDAKSLAALVDSLFPDGAPQAEAADTPCAVMAPHAGYVFSGQAAALALAGTRLPETLILLCPNHTGLGHPLGVWPDGAWETPLGAVPVNAELAESLCARGLFAKDTRSHLREHSLEVELPLLQRMAPDSPPSIVPVCVGTQDPRALAMAGGILADVCGQGIRDGSTGILISSDMNHYEDEETTMAKDERALECVLAQEPGALLERCRRERITMCGCGPMALALFCLRALRGTSGPSAPARLVCHTTSGKAFGDYARVVGYASVRVYL
ncbi:MAG: AmmeMemoRadiSam system protein B [Desulfovibrionaceae bacterium]|nr:AmmeMemoRadiSam system protein B [Desulfovibrionaceae bacterium]